jgi:hypothetical protein
MSEGITKRMVSEKTSLDEISKHDIYAGIPTPPSKKSNAGTLPQLTRVGSWCIYDPKRFCQETRCSDCIVSENNK